MKLYYAMLVCAGSAALTVFLALHPTQVSAESNPVPVVEHAQISELVTMAMPPYKW
ncbi:MAG TPA: hypothetical protein VGO72_02075 [Herminiimonas sp.]|jgi:hypothetical protein|nr:hypothetical protein [Herminiimonas sp.]